MSLFDTDTNGKLVNTDEASNKDLQEFLVLAQQRARFNANVQNFNDVCWDTCIDKPGSKIDKKTATCLSNCVDRFIDVTSFIANRYFQMTQRNAVLNDRLRDA